MGCRVPPTGERVSPHEHDAGDGLVSVDDHLALVLGAAAPLDAYAVPLSAARGRTLREPVTAMVDIPVFDNSAMDGFAVLFDDVANASAESPVTLTVVADLPAGTELDPPIAGGEAARIMTGSPTPTAATAIVPFEDTAADPPTRSAGSRSFRRRETRVRTSAAVAKMRSSVTSSYPRALCSARCRPPPPLLPVSRRSWSPGSPVSP